MNSREPQGGSRERLAAIARRAMMERGMAPDFPPQAVLELGRIAGPAAPGGDPGVRDARQLPWCSIDNDDSRDLDQLTAAQSLDDGRAKLFVAIADVDALVPSRSALDAHARENTTSVYTAGAIFPMLPERLSTDLTSLGPGVDRIGMVAEITLNGDGSQSDAVYYRALVRNRAKLAYDSVAAWLDQRGAMPAALVPVPEVAENLRLQDRLAQSLKARRRQHGALDLETIEARAVFEGGLLRDLAPDAKNRAKDLIEDFMIAANTATARFLAARGFPGLRRIVRTPKHWDGIVALAKGRGTNLPAAPDPVALEAFLRTARAADPVRFPDLSLSVIKLLGRGEYVVELPGQASAGHFGLAVQDYTHSTAPNRRYPDVITQRLLKAALNGGAPPYPVAELADLAARCTERQDAAHKIERQVAKSAAALLLEHRIGERFPALVTGASAKGVWVRIGDPPVEGKVVEGWEKAKIGDCVLAELVHADPERGHLDFKALGQSTACVVQRRGAR